MHILFIAPRLPVPPDTGGKIRTLNLLRQAAKFAKIHFVCFAFEREDKERGRILEEEGIEVTLIPPRKFRVLNKIGQALFGKLPMSVAKYYSDEMEAVLRELNETNHFDAVHIDHVHMAGYQDCLEGVPCVLDEHNVEFKILERCAGVERSLGKKFLYWDQARKMKQFETDRIQKVSSYLAVSNEDKDLLTGIGADPVKGHVVPNGVDTEYFSTQDIPTLANARSGLPSTSLGTTSRDPEQQSKGRLSEANVGTGHTTQEEAVVFTGSMDWLPNDDAALYFCKDTLPLIWKENPGVKFYIVGKGPSERLKRMAAGDGRIIVTGRVDDVRGYVERSKIFVVPLRIGGGTRLKILEAMSMRKAVVSTNIGAEGISCRHNEHIVLTDKPREFADAVCRLLGDHRQCEQIGSAGRAFVLENYDWNIIGLKLNKIYEYFKKHKS